jgi:hypothetical protein
MGRIYLIAQNKATQPKAERSKSAIANTAAAIF